MILATICSLNLLDPIGINLQTNLAKFSVNFLEAELPIVEIPAAKLPLSKLPAAVTQDW